MFISPRLSLLFRKGSQKVEGGGFFSLVLLSPYGCCDPCKTEECTFLINYLALTISCVWCKAWPGLHSPPAALSFLRKCHHQMAVTVCTKWHPNAYVVHWIGCHLGCNNSDPRTGVGVRCQEAAASEQFDCVLYTVTLLLPQRTANPFSWLLGSYQIRRFPDSSVWSLRLQFQNTARSISS